MAVVISKIKIVMLGQDKLAAKHKNKAEAV